MVPQTQEADGDESIELSPTRLNLLCDCERSFWVRMRRGEARPKKAFPSVVPGIEREIRAVFDQHRENGTLPRPLRESRLDATLLTDREFLSNCRTWQTEPTVVDPASGTMLRGAMDDLLERADGSYVPFDYKTHHPAGRGPPGLPAPTGVLRLPAPGERAPDRRLRAPALPDEWPHWRQTGHRTPLGAARDRPATVAHGAGRGGARRPRPRLHGRLRSLAETA